MPYVKCIFIFISCLFTFWHLCCVGSKLNSQASHSAKPTNKPNQQLQQLAQFHSHFHSLELSFFGSMSYTHNTHCTQRLHHVYDNDSNANNKTLFHFSLSLFLWAHRHSKRFRRHRLRLQHETNISSKLKLCIYLCLSFACLLALLVSIWFYVCNFSMCVFVFVCMRSLFFYSALTLTQLIVLFCCTMFTFLEPVNEIRSSRVNSPGYWHPFSQWCTLFVCACARARYLQRYRGVSAVKSDTQNGKLKHFMSKVEIAIYLKEIHSLYS